MDDDKNTEITEKPSDLEKFIDCLNAMDISYTVQPDNTVVLTYRRVRFTMDGERANW